MTDFLDAYSIQNWLETCPQAYLESTIARFTNPHPLKLVATANPDAMEAMLSKTVLRELEIRLDRIGLECQTPVAI